MLDELSNTQKLLMNFCSVIWRRKEIGFPQDRFCRNTVQGRYLLSDDNGNPTFYCISDLILHP